MKNRLFITLVFLMLVTAVKTQDVFLNYGWEPGTTPGPMGSIWNNGNTATFEEVTNDPDNARTGTGYLKVTVNSVPANSWDNQSVFQNIPVPHRDISYRFTIWMRATGEGTKTVNITCGVYQTWQELRRRGDVEISNEWKKYVLMVYVGNNEEIPLENGQEQIRFPVHFPTVGTFYIDDVSIIKSTIAGAEIRDSVITIDFGYGLEWIDEVDHNAFTVKVNGQPVDVKRAYMVDQEEGPFTLVNVVLENSVNPGDVVLISHDGTSGLVYSGYSPITPDFFAAAFEDEIVENLTTTSTGVKPNLSEKLNISIINNTLTVNKLENIKEIEIFSINGKKVKYVNNTSSINISDLLSGVYIIKVKTNNQSFVSKFVK